MGLDANEKNLQYIHHGVISVPKVPRAGGEMMYQSSNKIRMNKLNEKENAGQVQVHTFEVLRMRTGQRGLMIARPERAAPWIFLILDTSYSRDVAMS